jgi:tRNA pseudouridine38-40 synthase
MRIFIEICFDGTAYCGWQKQPNASSVQQTLEERWSELFNIPVTLLGCGRTDTGVHASQFFVHHDVLNGDYYDRLNLAKLNAVLPADIAVKQLFKVEDHFHARFDANKRSYIYRCTSIKNPFNRHFTFYYPLIREMTLEALQEAAELLFAVDSYQSFTKTNSGVEHYHCQLYEAQWVKTPDGLEFYISANRFLRGMVRLIVGMCFNYALGKISKSQILEDIKQGTQIQKSWSVPAEGLTLEKVAYPIPMEILSADFRI